MSIKSNQMHKRYYPKGIWEKYDFDICKIYWENNFDSQCLDIRKKNLEFVYNQLQLLGVKSFLIGKTLLGAYNNNSFLPDHDDDIGVFKKDKDKILKKVLPNLISNGFNLIRSNDHIISVEKDYRYIDICLFRRRTNSKIGYSSKYFPKYHFEDFEEIQFLGSNYLIPRDSDILLKKTYSKKFILNVIGKIGFLVKKAYRFRKYLRNKLIHKINLLPRFMLWTVNAKYELLDLNTFMSLNIEPPNSYNWKWRKLHLQKITLNGKHRKVSEIVNYLKNPEVTKDIERSTIETNTNSVFYEPINLNINFWWSGNNFFWYCVKYGFKKNVVPYKDINNYINSINSPMLYSSEYYNQLESMNDSEIYLFLKENPIEVHNNSIVGGKHRAFALIGRLVRCENYIPIHAIILK